MGEWQRALREAELTPAEQHIGLMLSTWMNYSAEDGRKVDTAYGAGHGVRQQTLAERSGRAVRTVSRAIAGLEANGYLYVHRRPGKTSIYGATLPTAATVHPLPTPDTRAGGPPTAEQGDPRHQRRTAYYSEDSDKAAAAASLTEPNQIDPDQLEDRMFEHAIREAQKRQADGRDIHSLPKYARKIAPDFHDQAVKELRGEQRAVAITACPLCDDNGFVDVGDSTRIRCTHRRTA